MAVTYGEAVQLSLKKLEGHLERLVQYLRSLGRGRRLLRPVGKVSKDLQDFSDTIHALTSYICNSVESRAQHPLFISAGDPGSFMKKPPSSNHIPKRSSTSPQDILEEQQVVAQEVDPTPLLLAYDSALKQISKFATMDPRCQRATSRLQLWGAGIIDDSPSLDEIIQEDTERYRAIGSIIMTALADIVKFGGKSQET